MNSLFLSGILALILGPTQFPIPADTPQIVTSCQVESNPSAFNHKVIQITAFASHGFEDFTLFDPACPSKFPVWLEYGGTKGSGTVYCCGADARRTRATPLVVENVTIPLLVDRNFTEFDRLIQLPPGRLVHVTLIGRFFSGPRGEKSKDSWGGYGHFGCCSLLAIEQIIAVERQERNDLNYSPSLTVPALAANCDSARAMLPFLKRT